MDRRLIDAQQLISWGLNANCVKSILQVINPVHVATFGKTTYYLNEFQEAWGAKYGILIQVPEVMPQVPEVWLKKVISICRKKSNISMHRGALPSDILHILKIKGRMRKKEIVFWLRFLMMKRMFLKPQTYQFEKSSFRRPVGRKFDQTVNSSLDYLSDKGFIKSSKVNKGVVEYSLTEGQSIKVFSNVKKLLSSFTQKPTNDHFQFMKIFMICVTNDQNLGVEKQRFRFCEKTFKDIFPRSNRRQKAYEIIKKAL